MKKKKCAVLGGGISGLNLAWELFKNPNIEVVLLEKESRLGGVIQSINQEGFFFEAGPRSFRGNSYALLKLIEQMGLQDQIVLADKSNSRRYLFHDQKLRQLPSKPSDLLFLKLGRSLLMPFFSELRAPVITFEDESIDEFATRRFGKRVAELFFDPMSLGIYAGDSKKLSVHSCFPSLVRCERQSGSVLRGMFAKKKQKRASPIDSHTIFTLQNGMQELIRALEKQLGSVIYKSCPVLKMEFQKDGVELVTPHENFFVDHVFSTLGAHKIKELLPNEKGFAYLGEIPYVSLAIVHLGYQSSVLQKKGFGYLIPSKEKESVLGMVWDSSIFPQQNQAPKQTRVSVMMHVKEGLSKQGMLDLARDAMKRHLGVGISPAFSSVSISKRAIPQCHVGHSKRLNQVRSLLQKSNSRLSLCGNYLEGVAVNDCIEMGNKECKEFISKI